MSTLPDETALSEPRYLSFVLRLVVDKDGRLLRGEIVDVSGRQRVPFGTWHGLFRQLRAWLNRPEETPFV